MLLTRYYYNLGLTGKQFIEYIDIPYKFYIRILHLYSQMLVNLHDWWGNVSWLKYTELKLYNLVNKIYLACAFLFR